MKTHMFRQFDFFQVPSVVLTAATAAAGGGGDGVVV
jgi:hypothetical protein